jgi:mRNA interferase MazF
MITSAENRRWNDDVVVSDLNGAGLPAASVIRCAKIATIDSQDAEQIGILPYNDRKKVAAHLARLLAGAVGVSRRR